MKSIMCQWPEWNRNRAIETYRREYQNAPKSDLRHGKVLVLAEWESPQEADTARLDWCDRNPMPDFSQVGNDSGWDIRAAIDAARKAPEPKITVIERPNEKADLPTPGE